MTERLFLYVSNLPSISEENIVPCNLCGFPIISNQRVILGETYCSSCYMILVLNLEEYENDSQM